MNEADWLAELEGLPTWKPSLQPMLIVTPHPDDETLGAGGLIAWQRGAGVDVAIAAVTDGEHAYRDVPGLAAVRRAEQTEALGRLGVGQDRIVRLEFPDSDVASHEEELVERLMPMVSGKTHVIAPWTGDFHPDHEACGRAAEQVARAAGATLTYYFFWTWHRGTFASIEHLALRRFPLSEELLRAKAEALSCHASQLGDDYGEPILPESLLGPARRSFEIFAIA